MTYPAGSPPSHRRLLALLVLNAALSLVIAVAMNPERAVAVAREDGQPCPVAAHICDFAGSLYGWLAAGDSGAVVAHAEPIEVMCDEVNRSTQSGGDFICRRSMPGERRVGYPIVAGGLGVLVAEDGYRAFLQAIVMQSRAGETDRYGDGSFRMVGVAVVDRTPEERARAEFEIDYIIGMTSIVCGTRGITRQLVFMGVKQGRPEDAPRITVAGISTPTFRSDREDDLFAGLLRWSLPVVEVSRAGTSHLDPCFDPDTLPDPEAALLTLADLPQGWRRSGFVGRDRAFPFYPEQLCGVDPSDLDSPSGGIGRRSAHVEFSGGREGPFVFHDIWLHAPGEAARSMVALRNVFAAILPCQRSETNEDGVPFSVALSTLAAPSLGDEAIAIREMIQAPGKTRVSEMVIVRVGDAVISVELQVIGTDAPAIDQQFLDALLRRALERLATLGL